MSSQKVRSFAKKVFSQALEQRTYHQTAFRENVVVDRKPVGLKRKADALVSIAEELLIQGLSRPEMASRLASMASQEVFAQARSRVVELLKQAPMPELSEQTREALEAPTGIDLAQEFGMDVLDKGMSLDLHAEASIDQISVHLGNGMHLE